MYRLLIIWMEERSENGHKWSKKDIGEINVILSGFNKQKPKEIHRAVRSLKDVKFWKATEFRSFLLYYGIVALRNHLPVDMYQHFLRLSCAARICYSDAHKTYIEIAKDWFETYIEEYINIYGSHSIGSNLHNLTHVVDDVQRFGCLMDTSTYPFENMLQFLKSRVKQNNLALEQITRRLVELSLDHEQLYATSSSKISSFPNLRFPFKLNGTLVFKEIQIDSSNTISAMRQSNSWFLTTCNEIVLMKYAFSQENKIIICGAPIKNKDNYFTFPASSKFFHIYKSDGEISDIIPFNLQKIKSKMVCLMDKFDFVFMPLLHTLK